MLEKKHELNAVTFEYLGGYSYDWTGIQIAENDISKKIALVEKAIELKRTAKCCYTKNSNEYKHLMKEAGKKWKEATAPL